MELARIDKENLKLTLTREELDALILGLKASFVIEDWEYPTLIGVKKEYVSKLIETLSEARPGTGSQR